MIYREIATKIKNLLDDRVIREVLLVVGARQVGKTTSVQQVIGAYPKALEINLEKRSDLRALIDGATSFRDFENLLKDHFDFHSEDPDQILFIDEAQESEQIGRFVRFMKEDWTGARVILSGSSMTRIFRDDQRVPVGRYHTLQVTPLSFREFVRASKREFLVQCISEFDAELSVEKLTPIFHSQYLELLDHYLTVGGLPEVVKAHYSSRNPFEIRTSLLLAQEDDFVRKSTIEERSLFQAGLKGVANFLGSPAKNSHIHEKQHIAERILSVERSWYLIHEIEQHGMSSSSKVLPKRYLYDIGIAQEVREMPFPHLSITATSNPALRTQLGGLFENALLLQLIEYQNSTARISGWKKSPKEQVEVDFIWRIGSQVVPIECKASLKITKRSFASLRQYLDVSHTRLGILVSAAPFEIFEEDNHTLVNVPLYLASGRAIEQIVRRYG